MPAIPKSSPWLAPLFLVLLHGKATPLLKTQLSTVALGLQYKPVKKISLALPQTWSRTLRSLLTCPCLCWPIYKSRTIIFISLMRWCQEVEFINRSPELLRVQASWQSNFHSRFLKPYAVVLSVHLFFSLLTKNWNHCWINHVGRGLEVSKKIEWDTDKFHEN